MISSGQRTDRYLDLCAVYLYDSLTPFGHSRSICYQRLSMASGRGGGVLGKGFLEREAYLLRTNRSISEEAMMALYSLSDTNISPSSAPAPLKKRLLQYDAVLDSVGRERERESCDMVDIGYFCCASFGRRRDGIPTGSLLPVSAERKCTAARLPV